MSAATYTARHGLIWAFGSNNVRTVKDAEQALPHLLDMALTERDPDLAEAWVARLADLIRAVREAKEQARRNPVELEAA